MYELPSIYGDSSVDNSSTHEATAIFKLDRATEKESVASQLEKRQERLLNKLESLKSLLNQMKIGLKGSSATSPECSAPTHHVVSADAQRVPQPTGQQQQEKTCVIPRDVVIGASPSRPPLSLWPLKHLLGLQSDVLLTSHVHSSISRKLPDRVRQLMDRGTSRAPTNRLRYPLVLTLIWKEMEKDCEVMVSPLVQTAIVGEVNLIRYLGRLLSPPYDEGDPAIATETDAWLEKVHGSLFHGTQKEQKALLEEIDSHLGAHGPYLGEGTSFGLADVALWSALLQLGLEKKAPENVSCWLATLRKDPAFSLPPGTYGFEQ